MGKVKGVKLLRHEKDLLASGELTEITHKGASSVWLSRACTQLEDSSACTCIYRHMGDTECAYLLETGTLPATQPYQTIVQGEDGRKYCEKYLRGQKYVDTTPTTIVEFLVPTAIVQNLWSVQHKPEDGVLSHGLGFAAGHTLPLFNESLAKGESKFAIVLVKRGSSKT
eukprot:741780-Rhodomonas_salina.1